MPFSTLTFGSTKSEMSARMCRPPRIFRVRCTNIFAVLSVKDTQRNRFTKYLYPITREIQFTDILWIKVENVRSKVLNQWKKTQNLSPRNQILYPNSDPFLSMWTWKETKTQFFPFSCNVYSTGWSAWRVFCFSCNVYDVRSGITRPGCLVEHHLGTLHAICDTVCHNLNIHQINIWRRFKSKREYLNPDVRSVVIHTGGDLSL